MARVKNGVMHLAIVALAIAACGGALLAPAGTAYGAEHDEDGVVRGEATTRAGIITVTTDKTEYVSGDVIIVSGKISTSLADTPVILQIFRDGNPVHINQITPAGDNTYWDVVRAEGVKWARDGTYEINVRYGADGKASVKFNFASKEAEADREDQVPVTGTYEVDAGNETFDVKYSVTGGAIRDMTLDWRDFTLVVDIESAGKAGTLTIEMPRKYIGAEKTQGQSVTDEVFIVLIDGAQVEYEESTSNQITREITVDFLEGDSEIRVIGTYAVPEFEDVVMAIVVAAGMLAAVVAARMSGRAGPRGGTKHAGLRIPAGATRAAAR